MASARTAVRRRLRQAAGGASGPGHSHVHGPQDLIAEQLDLVNGLVRAAVAEFMGAVSGEDQERYFGHLRFDNGRKIIGGGRARRAQQRDWLPRGQGQAQREEAGAPFIEQKMMGDVRFGLESESQGGAARAGRNAHGLQPTRGQSSDESRRPENRW